MILKMHSNQNTLFPDLLASVEQGFNVLDNDWKIN